MQGNRKKGVGRTHRTTGIAKIAVPSLADVHPRERLFALLDAARRKPAVWIAAPAGAGKTTLVADYCRARSLNVLWYRLDEGDADPASFFYYLRLAAQHATRRTRNQSTLPLLTPEYRNGLGTFTRNFFRRLLPQLPRGAMVVLDNYHDARPSEWLDEALAHALTELSPTHTVIFASREEPPSAFAGLRASANLALLDGAALELTPGETRAIARLRLGRTHLAPVTLQRLHERARGWVAGLVLLTERPVTSRKASGVQAITPGERAPRSIFEYFAHEVFRHIPGRTQELLVRTAFARGISAASAAQLNGVAVEEARQTLDRLARRGYFTVRLTDTDDCYEYHPLFRAFLAETARDRLDAAELRLLRARTADLLAADGRVEHAVQLLLDDDDWPTAATLIRVHASALVAQGRADTLAGWIVRLPGEWRDPWIRYWLGTTRIASDPAAAREDFTSALSGFRACGDAEQLLRCWCGIVDGYVAEGNDYSGLDQWLDGFRELLNEARSAPADAHAAALFSYVDGLFHRRSHAPELRTCAAHAETMLLTAAQPLVWLRQAASLIYYFLWNGELVRGERLMQSVFRNAQSRSEQPLCQVLRTVLESFRACQMQSPEECIRVAEQGLAVAERSGAHVLDHLLLGRCVYGQLLRGDLRAASAAASRLEPLVGRGRLHDALYSQLCSVVLVREGRATEALRASRRSVQWARACGWPFAAAMAIVVSAWVNTQLGRTAAAQRAVRRAKRMAHTMQSPMAVYFCAFTEAHLWHSEGQTARALESLRQALGLGEQMGGVNPPWYLRDEAVALYGMALEQGLSTRYIVDVARRLRLPAPAGHTSDLWPCRLRVFTLGRVRVVCDDAPLVFRGKTQKRPLDLLCALIAQGEHGVNSRALAGLLWPDCEERAARRAFDVALHRLRKLLGVEDCIVQEDGRLRIDPALCWVDAWALDHLLRHRNGATSRGTVESLNEMQANRMLSLYQGSFLGDREAAWALPLRERLRSRFLRAVVRRGEQLEQGSELNAAIEWYERALEIDPLAEELYRREIANYQRLERPGEALAVYRRCEQMLSTVLCS